MGEEGEEPVLRDFRRREVVRQPREGPAPIDRALGARLRPQGEVLRVTVTRAETICESTLPFRISKQTTPHHIITH